MADYKIIKEEELLGNIVSYTIAVKKINEWASTLPNHPYKNLGEIIEYKSIKRRPIYLVRLTTLFNKRTLHKKTEPFTGQQIEEQKFFKESDIDIWNINDPNSFNAENNTHYFTEGTFHLHIPGGQWVDPCPTCKSDGTIKCPECLGNKKIKCGECSGKGEDECHKCNSTGKNKCWACDGKGYNVETKIVPNGEYAYSEYKDGKEIRFYRDRTDTIKKTCAYCKGEGEIKCKLCGGSGVIVCQNCEGKGYIICKRCNGKGIVQCPTCQGNKFILNSFYVKKENTKNKQAQFVTYGDTFDAFPELRERADNFKRKPIFKSVATVINEEILPDEPFINKKLKQLIDNAQKKATKDYRIEKQFLEIEILDCTLIEYTFKGKIYNTLLVGEENEIIAGNNPIAEIAREYIESASSLMKEGKPVEALDIYHKAEEINSFELRETINLGITSAKAEIKKSHKAGALAGTIMSAIILLPLCFYYYFNINKVFGYASFMTDPDFFLHRHHPWAMLIFSALFLYSSYIATMETMTNNIKLQPSKKIRTTTATVIAILMALLLEGTLIFLNATGFTLLLTLIIWLFTFWL